MNEISPGLGITLMMNNYLHDVATALMIGSAAAILVMEKVVARVGEPAGVLFFLTAYRRLTRLFHWALAWIVIGGIPRTIWFQAVEWNMADPSNKYLFTALMIKHALMWVFVIAGSLIWARMRKVAKSVAQ